jgi:thioredoxin reductase/Pyruvate/2-oxoacid:ferredoxin oxidoreductase delta subunit
LGSFDAGWVLGAAVYLAPLAGGLALYFRRRRATERAHLRALERAEARGLHEPVSLHPVINRNRCMGCGACVEACPQGDVLGVIGGQAELVNPTHCIGHGACQRACPFDAITLVIGSETRGVEIPVLGADFQTDVPGIFVAGELAGMGLIRNAIEQGRRAVEAIRKLDGIGRGDRLDVVIVGAGPAGFAASLAAAQHGLRYVTLEQDALGGSLVHHPRGKIVVTHPVDVPMVGRVDLRSTSKESLLAFWERTRRETRLRVRERERVEAIERLPGDAGFEVRSTGGRYAARAVLLAVGRRGTPRRLGVPGEDRSKVVYRLADPEQYRDRRVLVVGGGDSALEAAAALARVRGTEVTLSYRGDGFFRAGPESEAGLEAARRTGRLEVILGSQVREIGPDAVRLATPSGERRLGNDTVIVCAGGVMPSDFLRAVGVRTRTKYGTPMQP